MSSESSETHLDVTNAVDAVATRFDKLSNNTLQRNVNKQSKMDIVNNSDANLGEKSDSKHISDYEDGYESEEDEIEIDENFLFEYFDKETRLANRHNDDFIRKRDALYELMENEALRQMNEYSYGIEDIDSYLDDWYETQEFLEEDDYDWYETHEFLEEDDWWFSRARHIDKGASGYNEVITDKESSPDLENFNSPVKNNLKTSPSYKKPWNSCNLKMISGKVDSKKLFVNLQREDLFKLREKIRKQSKRDKKKKSNWCQLNTNHPKTFDCRLCPFKADCKYLLMVHIVESHEDVAKEKKMMEARYLVPGSRPREVWFQCTDCSFVTRYKSSLQKHLLTTHKSVEGKIRYRENRCLPEHGRL